MYIIYLYVLFIRILRHLRAYRRILTSLITIRSCSDVACHDYYNLIVMYRWSSRAKTSRLIHIIILCIDSCKTLSTRTVYRQSN